MSAAKKYIKKQNLIVEALKDICPPVTASEGFKRNLFARIEAELESAGISGPLTASGKEQLIPVTVHTGADILSGHISLPLTKRLSDFLNSSSQFISLTDVKLVGPGGKQEILSEIHINKDTIKMIRTVDENTARGVGPCIPKTPVHTHIHMSDYELDGLLHCKKRETISQLLEKDSTFLPCTTVNIRDVHSDDLWHTGFAAINRKLVSALHRAE
jgi:hypothetical protein